MANKMSGDIKKNIEKAEMGFRVISKQGNRDGKPYAKKQLERPKRRLHEKHVLGIKLNELDN